MRKHAVFTTVLAALFVTTTVYASEDDRPNVCLVGAGITSATISHFLTKEPLQPAPRILVFEKSAKVGGRIATVELQTKHKTVKVEAGASIIAQSNQLMAYFTQFLNLTRRSPPDRTLGLWDGKQFLLRTVAGSPTRNKMTFARRYGLSLVRMKRYVGDLLASFGNVYPRDGAGAEWRACETFEELFDQSPGLYNLTQIDFSQVIDENFGAQFGSELIAAVTRVNYGQDPAEMNGFSGAVALAGSGADLWAVEGGNVQVVEGLFASAGVQLLLNKSVQRILSKEWDGKKTLEVQADGDSWTCDLVALAAPYELTDITLPKGLAEALDVDRKFHRTYAAFVRGFLNEDTFGSNPPDNVLSTEGVSEPFTSIGKAWSGNHGEEPPIFKVFSKTSLNEEALTRIFRDEAEVLAEFPWLAYPKFNAPEAFPKFIADLDGGCIVYTSPIESAASAMEMSAVSGANAAALIKLKLGLTSVTSGPAHGKDEL